MRREKREKRSPHKKPLHPREYYWAVNRTEAEGMLVWLLLVAPNTLARRYVEDALRNPKPIKELQVTELRRYVGIVKRRLELERTRHAQNP